MAIIFGNINNGTGGGAGNLWAFNAAPDTTIKLNDAAGVTGITAPLPILSDMVFLFKEFAPGLNVGGFVLYNTATKFCFSGVVRSGGVDSSGFYSLDSVSGAENGYSALFQGGQPVITKRATDGANNVNDGTIEASQETNTIEDLVTLDKTVIQQTASAYEVNAYSSGVEKFRLRVTPGGLKLSINAGADLAFAIDENGLIFTNQSEAPTATDTTIINRIPVYDEVGAFVGYIPLMVDP